MTPKMLSMTSTITTTDFRGFLFLTRQVRPGPRSEGICGHAPQMPCNEYRRYFVAGLMVECTAAAGPLAGGAAVAVTGNADPARQFTCFQQLTQVTSLLFAT